MAKILLAVAVLAIIAPSAYGQSGCSACRSAIRSVQVIIQEAEQNFIKGAQVVCSTIQKEDVKKACDNLIQEFIKFLVGWTYNLSDRQLCEFMGICKPNEGRMIECVTEVAAVDGKEPGPCDHLSSEKAKSFCLFIASTRFDFIGKKQLLNWAKHANDCETNRKKRDTTEVQAIQSTDSPGCTFCTGFLDFVNEHILQGVIKDLLAGFLNSVCLMVPGGPGVQQNCVQFVTTFSETLFDLLEQTLKPSSLCVTINLCPAPERIALPKASPKK